MEVLNIPTKAEQQVAQQNQAPLEEISKKHNRSNIPIKVEVDGEGSITIPASAFNYLSSIMKHMAEGKAISIIPSEPEMTTQQVAEMLQVSRPYVVKLLDTGEIPHRMVGTHRRVKAEDVKAYQKDSKINRRKNLKKLAELTQEMDI